MIRFLRSSSIIYIAGLALLSCEHDATQSAHAPSPTTGAWFQEVTAASNIDFRHESGHEKRHWLPEIMTGGVGIFDYDNDGDLDVYFVQGGSLNRTSNLAGNRLYRNDGSGRFDDVTATAGVGDTGYGMGCACGDYDDDGDVDLYVTNVGANVLYVNNGDGTFSDVTAVAGVGDAGWGTSAAFLDIDTDGDLDLFIANYLDWSKEREGDCTVRSQPSYCSPGYYDASARDTLYRNRGAGTFEDVTVAAGLETSYGNGLGVAWADFNGDGAIDIYVANDESPNQLWINSGNGATFSDEALLFGCAVNYDGVPEAGMGVATVDLENDGDMDLFMTHLRGETNTFYRHDGTFFDDVTPQMGLGPPSLEFTGFGLGFADFDHDGYLDLAVVNGRVERVQPQYDPEDPYAEPNQLYRGRPDGRFEEINALPKRMGNSRGAALGDLDNDGDIDIVVANRDGTPQVLRNEVGSRGQWIQFRVIWRDGSDALGAEVIIRTDKRPQQRRVAPAYSYCSSNDPRVHFGLGSSRVANDVTVTWPDGVTQSFGSLEAGKIHTLRRDSKSP